MLHSKTKERGLLIIRFKRLIILFIILLFFVSCNDNPSKQEADYEVTKKMVVDILQTEDGKKAIQEIISSDELKEHLTIESEIVKKSINETLLSERGKKMWQSLFEDPSFAKDFALSMSNSHKELLKQLMKDPEYQQLFIDLFQDPETNKITLQLLKSNEFRSHIQDVVTETIESPLFQAKMAEILMKVKDAGEEKDTDTNDGKQK